MQCRVPTVFNCAWLNCWRTRSKVIGIRKTPLEDKPIDVLHWTKPRRCSIPCLPWLWSSTTSNSLTSTGPKIWLFGSILTKWFTLSCLVVNTHATVLDTKSTQSMHLTPHPKVQTDLSVRRAKDPLHLSGQLTLPITLRVHQSVNGITLRNLRPKIIQRLCLPIPHQSPERTKVVGEETVVETQRRPTDRQPTSTDGIGRPTQRWSPLNIHVFVLMLLDLSFTHNYLWYI